MKINDPELVTMKEAAGLAGVTTQCIFQWQWRGKLHAIKVNGRWMTTPEEVHRAAELMDQNPAGRKRRREREELALAKELAQVEAPEYAAV